MAYYIRILGLDPATVPLSDLQRASHPGLLDGTESEGEWNELTLSHRSGAEIAIIERNPVIDGELGAEEIQEFIEEVRSCKPESASAWLQNYLPTVKVIYAFQLLDGTDVEDGWSLLHSVYGEIKAHAGGIAQADGEGFSNEDGYTILWQFSDAVTGDWNCAVLAEDGGWIGFEMDLGDQAHRQAFWRGEVPTGAKRTEP